jgi:hypothetical protein
MEGKMCGKEIANDKREYLIKLLAPVPIIRTYK